MLGFGLVEKSAANIELQTAIKNKKYVHAYLIVGEKGVGKRSFARFSAVSFICSHSIDECNTCSRILSGFHPDVRIVRAAGKQILIDQIREIITEASIRPYEADIKVFVIEQADRMTVAAQNCLLKLLEEPPANVVFILTAESTKSVLPTVLSRCQLLRLEPASTVDLIDELIVKHSITHSDAEVIARNARGNMLSAEQLLDNSDYWNMRDSIIMAVGAVVDKDMLKALSILGELKDKLENGLETLCNWIRDLIIYRLGNNNLIINSDKIQDISTQGEKVDIARLLKMQTAVINAEARIKRNTSFTSIIDGMVIELMEE